MQERVIEVPQPPDADGPRRSELFLPEFDRRHAGTGKNGDPPPVGTVARRTSRLSRSLLVVALIGSISAALITQSAVRGVARLEGAHRASGRMLTLQREHQKMRVLKNALRADVFNASLTGRGAGIDTADSIRSRTAADAMRLREVLSALAVLRPGREGAGALAALDSPLREYADDAEQLVEQALADPQRARTGLASFDREYHRLELLQGKAAGVLSRASRVGEEQARDQERSVQREVLTLSAMAIVVLAALAFALRRMACRAQAALKELHVHQTRFAALVNHSSDVIMVVGADGLIAYESPAVEQVLGYDPMERVGTPATHYVHPDDVAVALSRFGVEGAPVDAPVIAEIRLRHRNGSWRWFEAVWSNLLDVPEVEGVVVNLRETSQRKALEDGLFREREFLTAVLESLADGIVACDADGALTLFNDATRRFHGLPAQSLPADQWAQHYDLYLADQTTPMVSGDIPLFRALSGEAVHEEEMVIAPKNGRRRLIQASGRAIFGPDGSKLGAVVALHDTTERREAEHKLVRLALEDSLTGLGNRTSLASRFEEARGRAALTGSTLAVLIVDLDDFKKVNDSLGHGAGDLVLVDFATRLRSCLRENDLAVRLGGDEFAVLLEGASENDAVLVAERVLRATRSPFGIAPTGITGGASDISVGASIGIAVSEGGVDDAEKMLRLSLIHI